MHNFIQSIPHLLHVTIWKKIYNNVAQAAKETFVSRTGCAHLKLQRWKTQNFEKVPANVHSSHSKSSGASD